MKNAKDKAIGMETGVLQSREKKMPKSVPMRNDMQAQNAYPNPKGNVLKAFAGNAVDRMLKSAPMTESARLRLIDRKNK